MDGGSSSSASRGIEEAVGVAQALGERPAKTGVWSESALRVLRERYLRRDAAGVKETPEEMCWRVAAAIAKAEERWGKSPAEARKTAESFYDVMVEGKFIPNSPTMMNAGKDNGLQFSACFVLPVEDSMEGIFEAVKRAAIIHKSGGGCIAGDARVWTTFCGLEPIEVLVNRITADGRPSVRRGDGLAYDVGDLAIRTVSMNPETGETGLRGVTHVWRFDVPAEQQVVVQTREGTRVQTSAWHPFMVVRPDGLTAVRADALTPGDVILGPDRPDAYWPYHTHQKVGNLILDEPLGWLVGFTLGDGSFGYAPALRQYRLRWFSGAPDVLERVRSVLSREGIQVAIQKDARGLLSVSTLTQRFVLDMLEASGLQKIGPKDDRVRVPELITKSPLSVIRAFIAGLLDSDGYVDRDGSPSYSTVSREMADDLAGLMSILGYQPSVSAKPPYGKGTRTVFTVQLCPLPQVNDLRADISAYAASVRRLTRLRSASRKQFALRLPFRPWRDRLKVMGLVQGSRRKGAGPCAEEFNRWSCNVKRRCRRDDLLKIADAVFPHDCELADLLRRVANRGMEIQAVSLASQPKAYYDLTVEDWNTYAAGSRGMAMVHNTGFAFSRLRPKDTLVKSTSGKASGPISFLRVFNGATEAVKQGGTRRGANMGILKVDHPDILEFIDCKLDGGITNFNISVAATEKFMDALAKDETYELFDPHTKQVTGRLRAREVFDRIVQAAWRTGDPGMVFIDRINASPANPVPLDEVIEATNPCGEQPLGPNDACNLGSINLATFYLRSIPTNAKAAERIDWVGLEHAVRASVRFLDDVIEVNPYPLQDIIDEVRNNRRIGLGVMGWADLLLELGIPYDSDDALRLGEETMGFIQRIGHDASERLAGERGPFPRWHRSIYKDKAPLRNSTVTTIAPTGTISIIAGCSSGIEPIFAVAFSHIVGDRHLTFINPVFEQVAKRRGFYSEELMQQVAQRGMVRGLEGVPEDVQRVFVTAHEIDPSWHVKMQTAFQKQTDNGVSKTINLPNSATPEDIAKAYLMAYDLGCLGITVFRDGCKETQVLHMGTGGKTEQKDAAPLSRSPEFVGQAPLVTTGARQEEGLKVKPRPRTVKGVTYRAETPLGVAYITVNQSGEGEPFEVFANVGKVGSDTSAVSEAIGRLVSLILRLPSPMSPRERVEQIVNQLSGIGGRRPMGFGKDRVRSLPDAIAQVLSEHIGLTEPGVHEMLAARGKTTLKAGDMCPDCGLATVVYEEGCQKCYSCGFSEC
ncbi:MAG: adenosylcobalamin-dependent ribonucleoside-diphosphate reductase [candidate division NC10 bacterium]|nr:adenosylcobalamin-dependent ribonucleoside-diphosphate reductase [candidate division NC10 bacterium]